MNPVNLTLAQKIKYMMGNLAKAELELVLQNLRREFFQPLGSTHRKHSSGTIKIWKKITPSCKLNVKKEPNKFDIPL